MPDYIPGPDEEFDIWQAAFEAYITAQTANLALVAADTGPITTALGVWSGAYGNHLAAVTAAQAARQAKDDARRDYEAVIRPLVRRLQASPAVDDAERQNLGITVRDTVATPSPAPTSKPVAQVDTRQRLRHTIHFADEGTPTKKAKPAGVLGAEIFYALKTAGAPGPASASELSFLALDTATPYVVDFDGADGGKTAWYWIRWVGKGPGQPKGPWSEPVSASVGV